MKESTKRILEAGLVDRHVLALCQRWGTLDPKDIEEVARREVATKEQFEKFAGELEDLLDQERRTIKETPLDTPPEAAHRFHILGTQMRFIALRDQMGRLLVQPETEVIRGHRLMEVSGDGRAQVGPLYEVWDIEKLYSGEQVTKKLVTVVSLP